jgi:glyoxylase-like metal-dependent hydrolase (beta-lactamase superfamily II)
VGGWQVGRAKITPIIEVETITSPRFLFRGLDKPGVKAVAEQSPWLAGSFVDDDGYLLQRIQCLVIEIDGTRIAVDTCVGNDKTRANPGWHNLQLPFLDDLAAAGFPADSIDAVICTHLHVDHVGWNTMLVDGRWVPTFPNARYVFTEPEFEYWRATSYPDGDDIFGDSVAPVVDAGRADLVPVDHRLDGGVRLDSTPGHTPGHVSVVIESEGRQAVITGDMIHTPIQIANVDLSSAFDYDQRAAADTRRDFLARYADGALVIGTHWGGPGAGRIRSEGNGQWGIEAVPASVTSGSAPPSGRSGDG